MAFICSPNSSETPSFAWLPIWRLNGAFLVLLLITSTWPVKWRGLGDDPKWRPQIMINLTSSAPVVGGGTSDTPLITGVDVEGISAHEQRNQRATQTEGFWVVLMRKFTIEHAQFLFSATEWHSRGGETKYYQLNDIPRQRMHFLV